MSTTQKLGRQVGLAQIRVPENVRALDDAHVQALAGSIAPQEMLVPVVVCDDGDGFELVVGFHRIAAARSLDLAEVPSWFARPKPRTPIARTALASS